MGVGSALAVALPAALLAQILDAVHEGEGPPPATWPLGLVVLLGPALGGFVVGRRGGSLAVGAAAGALAIVLVLALGIARRSVAGEDVAWATVPLTVAAATALAIVGGAMGSRRPGRKRP